VIRISAMTPKETSVSPQDAVRPVSMAESVGAPGARVVMCRAVPHTGSNRFTGGRSQFAQSNRAPNSVSYLMPKRLCERDPFNQVFRSARLLLRMES
jgi:hypothetical protein